MLERARRPVFSVGSSSEGWSWNLGLKEGVLLALARLWCEKGESSATVSSSSSSHISSDSVMPFLRRRVTLRISLCLAVGLCGSLCNDWQPFVKNSLPFAVSSSMRVVLTSAPESLSSSTNPIPGLEGFWETGGRVPGSLVRRHERARTPKRRIRVPRAIWQIVRRSTGKPGIEQGNAY